MVKLEQQEEVSSIENKHEKTHRSNNPTPKKEKDRITVRDVMNLLTEKREIPTKKKHQTKPKTTTTTKKI